MDQSNKPQQTNNSINMHQQKLYSLIGGGIGFIGLILPWVSYGGFGGMGGTSGNGFSGWGILSLFGVIGVVVSSFMGDKMQPYDNNFKLVAIGSFVALALGALIVFMQLSNSGFGGVKSGIGVWLCMIAGILGVLWVTGVIKLPPPSKTPPAN